MTEFTNVRNGFDLELILENKFLKHIIAILVDAEPEVYIDGFSALKGYQDILRDYPISFGDQTEGPIVEIAEFPNSPFFYVMLDFISERNYLNISDLEEF